jgi:SrtB family sortase
LSNNYNSYNTNNINNNNKKGGGVARVFLYLLFLGLLIAAGVIGYIALTQEPTVIVIPPEKQISKEEIIVEEKDKYEIKIDADLVKMSPDVDLNQERTAHNNPDIIGRLEVPDLFNVLVVRGANNSDYLSIDVDKNSDVKGAVFMDYRVGPDSNQINIYGHNSREITLDVPFRRLESFLDKTYFDSHPYIIFQHDHGKRVYKVVTINEVYNSNREHMKVNKTGIDFMDHMNAILTNNALNVRNLSYDENSRFIILQTCSHHWDDAVYLIIGEAIDYAEE